MLLPSEKVSTNRLGGDFVFLLLLYCLVVSSPVGSWILEHLERANGRGHLAGGLLEVTWKLFPEPRQSNFAVPEVRGPLCPHTSVIVRGLFGGPNLRVHWHSNEKRQTNNSELIRENKWALQMPHSEHSMTLSSGESSEDKGLSDFI